MSKSFSRFAKSFRNALRGLAYLFESQANARIELIIAILIIIAGILFKINSQEWIMIVICIALVIGFEGINTSLEILADKIHPEFDVQIGKAKDLAAGAVLLVSIFAAIVGITIFAPRILVLLLR